MFQMQSARYLTFDRRITECWSQLGAAVCSAQALGLHRDPAAMVSAVIFRREAMGIDDTNSIWNLPRSSTGGVYGMH